jgi:phosphatidylserine/phosphatidylglycerophosphate/cardiolipin synthase-like enzyme
MNQDLEPRSRPGLAPPRKDAYHPRYPVEVLGATNFWGNALKEVAAARSTVFLGSLCYDNSKLQTQLLAALGRAVKVEVLLDRASFRSGLAPRAAERVAKLKEKGAKVYLASGKTYRAVFGRDGQPGNYHVKALVVDGFVAFVGSPNATNNSCVNGELAFKVSGKAVAKDTYDTAWAEAMRVETY